MSDIIKVGMKVDIRTTKKELTKDGVEKNYRSYKSKIFDIIDENILKVTIPLEGGSLVLLPVDGIFEIFFYTTNGLYESKCKILERSKENNVYLMSVELQTPVRKNQRREYFRYQCTIDLKYSIITDKEAELLTLEDIEEARGGKLLWKEGFIVDISGGGVRITGGNQFEKGSFVVCKFNLMINHRMKEFNGLIKIISSEKLLNRSNQYESRGKFINLTREETEEIVKYIFEEERKSRKNRKS